MEMNVIGCGVGRTGTYSLKLALDQLGLGPCHHMEEVLHHMPTQVPLWTAAVAGQPDWARTYDGYHSAVDWPTACFFRELREAFPSARFVLTERDPERWADSFGETIYTLVANGQEAPAHMQEWMKMAQALVAQTGFPPGLDRDELIRAFVAHNEAVRAAIPEEQLLVFDVRQGWEPLCEFLDAPVPDEAFPRTNHLEEFWDRVNSTG